jgi:tRNA modification GTPase
VADLIHAKTDLSHRASLRQLDGKLSAIVRTLRQELLNICSLLELELDFSEEGIEVADKREIDLKLETLIAQLKNLLDSYRVGKISREGVKAVIVGKPNVGKSSIINNLLNENRAIVTDIPGTTRDVLREELDLGGVLFTVSDTAGLRKSDDVIEREGISRTHNEAMTADLILYVVDSSGPVNDEDRKIFRQIKLSNDLAGTIIVGNKNDLTDQKEKFIREFIADDPHYILCSAKTGVGMAELKSAMVKIALRSDQNLIEKSVPITNLRHKQAIEKALWNLNAALADIRDKKSNEFSSLDIRLAMDNLGEIIGEVTTDDLLNNIFSKFCIGK